MHMSVVRSSRINPVALDLTALVLSGRLALRMNSPGQDVPMRGFNWARYVIAHLWRVSSQMGESRAHMR